MMATLISLGLSLGIVAIAGLLWAFCRIGEVQDDGDRTAERLALLEAVVDRLEHSTAPDATLFRELFDDLRGVESRLESALNEQAKEIDCLRGLRRRDPEGHPLPLGWGE